MELALWHSANGEGRRTDSIDSLRAKKEAPWFNQGGGHVLTRIQNILFEKDEEVEAVVASSTA